MVFCSKDVKILYHGDHNVEPFSMLYSTYLQKKQCNVQATAKSELVALIHMVDIRDPIDAAGIHTWLQTLDMGDTEQHTQQTINRPNRKGRKKQ